MTENNELNNGIESPTSLSPSAWTGGGRRRGTRKSRGKKSKSMTGGKRRTKRSTGKRVKKSGKSRKSRGRR